VAEDLRVFHHVGFFFPARQTITEGLAVKNISDPVSVTHGLENTMRRFITGFGKVASQSGTIVKRAPLRRVACLTALVGGLALAQGFANEPAEPEARPINKIKPASAATPATEAAIPACLEELKLSQPQQTQAKEVVRKYDAKLDAVWKQFGEKYMETVRTEVALLAAIEDKLTEPQRTYVRDKRRKVAHAEKALEGTNSNPNQATAKPADAAEQEIAGVGISLTPEQEATADMIHQKYVGHLRSLNRDIQGLHTRLVSLEADKLVELEKLLTKEQLAQLREGRQSVTGAPKVTNADKVPTTTE
jgi:hypothetical protein